MKMYTEAFNQMRDLNKFVNDAGILQENIINIFQSKDGLFYLSWYAEQ